MVSILTLVANESLKNQNSRSSTPSEGNESDTQDKLYDTDAVLLNLRDKLIKGTNMNRPAFQLGPTSLDAGSDTTLENEQIEIDVRKDDSSADSMTSVESGDSDIVEDNMTLTQEDFLIWSVETAESLVTPFLDLIFEVCHIVLGLRPQCKHQEGDIGKFYLCQVYCDIMIILLTFNILTFLRSCAVYI